MATQLTLTPSTQLQPGQSYTFYFNALDINPFVQPSDIVTDILNGIDYVTNVNVNQGVGPYYVQLLYQGDGTDTVDSLASDIENVVNSNHTLFTFTFQSAVTGFQTVGTLADMGSTAVQQAKDSNLASLAPSTTTLVLVVIGIALIVFVMSGGPQLVREAT